jgi:hypothetical protein
MLAFMTFIEKDGDFVAGYLGTDEELAPIEFIFTESIKPATTLEKILHGTQFEQKWFGDIIAGTLYEGTKKSENAGEKSIKAIFVSHPEMLNLRRKTGETPVLHITDNEEIVTHENYAGDSQIIASLPQGEISYSDTQEVFGRIQRGIEESVSSSEETTAH